MPTRTVSSGEARSNWRRLLESALTGDSDTIIERYGQPIGALIPFADYIAVLETLEDMRLARQAMPALEEWQTDPSTARPWREVFAELGVDVSDEKFLDCNSSTAGSESVAPFTAKCAESVGKRLSGT